MVPSCFDVRVGCPACEHSMRCARASPVRVGVRARVWGELRATPRAGPGALRRVTRETDRYRDPIVRSGSGQTPDGRDLRLPPPGGPTVDATDPMFVAFTCSAPSPAWLPPGRHVFSPSAPSGGEPARETTRPYGWSHSLRRSHTRASFASLPGLSRNRARLPSHSPPPRHAARPPCRRSWPGHAAGARDPPRSPSRGRS